MKQLKNLLPSKTFSVTCSFTCFKYSVSSSKDVKGNGDLFDELKLNLIFSSQPAAADIDLSDLTANKKLLPFFCFCTTLFNKQSLPHQNACKNFWSWETETNLCCSYSCCIIDVKQIRKNFGYSFKEAQRK